MDLRVAADDRTGAYETAAALADGGVGPVTVSVWSPGGTAHAGVGVRVVDLGTRHLAPSEAGGRAAALAHDGPAAHKIDSTLRGNWAAELVARHRSTGRPVLLVPALPALGRTCVNGAVLVDGRPVHETAIADDARAGVDTSHPATLLARAGAERVTAAPTLGDVARWLGDPTGIVVADAATDDTIAEIVGRWAARADVLLAGTAAVIGAAAEPLPIHAVAHRDPRAAVDGPVLVVCGSVHPTARRQVAHAERRGAGVMAVSVSDGGGPPTRLPGDGHVVLVTEPPAGRVDDAAAGRAASSLAAMAHRLLGARSFGALVLIGGDTAAAVLGDGEVTVHGSLAPGTACATAPGFDPPVVTRAGGFGGEGALVDLLWGTLAR